MWIDAVRHTQSHPPLEGEGRHKRSEWRGGVNREASKLTPPRLAPRMARCSPTLPLQGRVNGARGMVDTPMTQVRA